MASSTPMKIFTSCLINQVRKWADLGRRSNITFADAWRESRILAVDEFAKTVEGEVEQDGKDFIVSNGDAIYKLSVEDNQFKVLTMGLNETAEEIETLKAMSAKMNLELFPPSPPPYSDPKVQLRAKIHKLLNIKRNATQETKLAIYESQLRALERKDGTGSSGSGGSGKK